MRGQQVFVLSPWRGGNVGAVSVAICGAIFIWEMMGSVLPEEYRRWAVSATSRGRRVWKLIADKKTKPCLSQISPVET